jgi:hypothetical protein
MTDLIITNVTQAKAAYQDGKTVEVDVDATPLRFIVEPSLGGRHLDLKYGGNWFSVDDNYDASWSSQVVFNSTKTSIATIKDLADFIQAGGGDCYIGSLVIDEAEALKLQKTGKEILRDSNDKTRHIVVPKDYDGDLLYYVLDYMLGGDWEYIELKDELIDVDFFWSLSHQAECYYDVQNLRVTRADASCNELDKKYGGDWVCFDLLTSSTIDKFAAKSLEENNNA